jgi:hypothetical protein
MKQFLNLLWLNFLLIRRNKLIEVSLVVTALYMLVFYWLQMLPSVDKLLVLIIFNDPAILGFLFVGVMVLFVGTFAQNKIEGMALFKGVDLLLLLPIVSFFVPSVWAYLFALMPMYFTFHWYESLHSGAQISVWLPYALGGALVFGAYLFGLYRLFRRRVYN